MPPKTAAKKKTSKQTGAGPPVHPQDLFALRSLYESTGGPFRWQAQANWCTAAPLAAWAGVRVHGETGRVTELGLRGNGLAHAVPDAVGLLSELEVLDFGGNPELAGPVPAALGNLPHLRTLLLDGCALDAPLAGGAEGSLRCNSREEVLALFNRVGGTIAAKDRPALAQLFVAWGGLGWLNRAHWCSSKPLGVWHGVTAGGGSSRGRVTHLYLGGNGLAGPLHAGASGLEALNQLAKLSLFGNFLSGPVPASLALLPHLTYVDLEANDRLAYVPPLGTALQPDARAGTRRTGDSAAAVAAPVKLECKTVADLRDLLRALGLEDLHTREVAKEKKRERERQARLDKAAAKASRAAAGAAAALAEAAAQLEGGHSASSHGEAGGKLNFSSLAKRKEEAEAALLRERPALLAFGDATGRRTHWRDAAGWGVTGSSEPGTGQGRGSGAAAAALRADLVSDEWVGVTLEPRGSGRVGRLQLSANALAGSFTLAGDVLFPALGKLCVLDLRANALTGRLPPSIGLLHGLEELYLSLNFLAGPLPDALGDCSRLQKCGLNGNRLSGPLPPSLARCGSLRYFDLSCNPRLHVPEGTNLECTSQVAVVHLLQALGILKRR